MHSKQQLPISKKNRQTLLELPRKTCLPEMAFFKVVSALFAKLNTKSTQIKNVVRRLSPTIVNSKHRWFAGDFTKDVDCKQSCSRQHFVSNDFLTPLCWKGGHFVSSSVQARRSCGQVRCHSHQLSSVLCRSRCSVGTMKREQHMLPQRVWALQSCLKKPRVLDISQELLWENQNFEAACTRTNTTMFTTKIPSGFPLYPESPLKLSDRSTPCSHIRKQLPSMRRVYRNTDENFIMSSTSQWKREAETHRSWRHQLLLTSFDRNRHKGINMRDSKGQDVVEQILDKFGIHLKGTVLHHKWAAPRAPERRHQVDALHAPTCERAHWHLWFPGTKPRQDERQICHHLSDNNLQKPLTSRRKRITAGITKKNSAHKEHSHPGWALHTNQVLQSFPCHLQLEKPFRCTPLLLTQNAESNLKNQRLPRRETESSAGPDHWTKKFCETIRAQGTVEKEAFQVTTNSRALTSSWIVFWFGFSMSCLERVPGLVRLVRIIVFFDWPHHCMKRSREKPHCMSGILASTTWNETTNEPKTHLTRKLKFVRMVWAQISTCKASVLVTLLVFALIWLSSQGCDWKICYCSSWAICWAQVFGCNEHTDNWNRSSTRRSQETLKDSREMSRLFLPQSLPPTGGSLALHAILLSVCTGQIGWGGGSWWWDCWCCWPTNRRTQVHLLEGKDWPTCSNKELVQFHTVQHLCAFPEAGLLAILSLLLCRGVSVKCNTLFVPRHQTSQWKIVRSNRGHRNSSWAIKREHPVASIFRGDATKRPNGQVVVCITRVTHSLPYERCVSLSCRLSLNAFWTASKVTARSRKTMGGAHPIPGT